MNLKDLTCLTEQNLIIYLKQLFPEVNDWIYNKPFPGYRFRPDYRSDSLKLCVEFDGPRHYTIGRTIQQDYLKDREYIRNGYSVVRVPYYVQLDKRTNKALFGIDSAITNNYPHGFIAQVDTMVYPADFCEWGLSKFHEELNGPLNCIEEDVYRSIFELCMGDPYLDKLQKMYGKELWEKQISYDLDHILTERALAFGDQQIVSDIFDNSGKYTKKFI